MYYIYEIIGVKVGVTKRSLKRRFKENVTSYAKKGIDISDKEIILIETCLTISEATRREKELQVEKGYKVDKFSYNHSINNVFKYFLDPKVRAEGCMSKESRAKAGKSISKVLKGRKRPEEVASKNRKAIIGYKIIRKTRKEILEVEEVGRYKSSYHAAEALGLYQGDIYNVLRPKSCVRLTKGYTFKYA